MNPLSGPGGLHERVVDVIGRRIATGELEPGAVLSTEGIEAEHGVSRSVVREVLRTLTGLGMVRPRQRIGTVVQPVQSWNLLDPHVITWRAQGPDSRKQLGELLTLREALEPIGAQCAAARRDADAVLTLREALTRMEAAFQDGKPHDFAIADTEFHEALLRGANNDVLSQLVQTVLATLRARYAGHRSFSDETALSLVRHSQLVDAVEAGDEAAAEAVSRALVREARAEVLGEPEMGN